MRSVISARFEFAEVARHSLGAEWRRLTLAKQQQFVALFTDLLRDAYVADIESYKREKVSYTPGLTGTRRTAVFRLKRHRCGGQALARGTGGISCCLEHFARRLTGAAIFRFRRGRQSLWLNRMVTRQTNAVALAPDALEGAIDLIHFDLVPTVQTVE